MRQHNILTSSLLFLCIGICACNNSGTNDSGNLPRHNIEPADSPAYLLGKEHAQMMLDQCHSTGELRDRLLDLRAREHIIRTQVGSSSADAYVDGIEQQIARSCDTLAQALRLSSSRERE